MLDDQRQRVARIVDRENLCSAGTGLGQRLVGSCSSVSEVVEERRVDDASRDGPLIRCEHHAPTTPDRARAGPSQRRRTCSPTTQAAVRNTSVPSVAHAAPSMDSAGTSCVLRPMLTSSAAPHVAAYSSLAAPRDQLVRERVVERQQRKRQREDTKRRNCRRVLQHRSVLESGTVQRSTTRHSQRPRKR